MKYNLVGIDGNAFSIMGYVTNAMKKEKISKKDRDSYVSRAMSGSYDNLLAESVKIIDSLNSKYEDDDDMMFEDYDEDEYIDFN